MGAFMCCSSERQNDNPFKDEQKPRERRTFSVLKAQQDQKMGEKEAAAQKAKEAAEEAKNKSDESAESPEEKASRLELEREADEAQQALEEARKAAEQEAAQFIQDQNETAQKENEEHAAAIKIQAIRRGNMERKKVTEKKESMANDGVQEGDAEGDATKQGGGKKMKIGVEFVAAFELVSLNWTGDKPWASCEVMRYKVECHTEVKDGLNPQWNEKHEIDWWEGEPLHFAVWNQGSLKSKQEGETIVIPSKEFYPDGLDARKPIPGLEGDTELHVRISILSAPVAAEEVESF